MADQQLAGTTRNRVEPMDPDLLSSRTATEESELAQHQRIVKAYTMWRKNPCLTHEPSKITHSLGKQSFNA